MKRSGILILCLTILLIGCTKRKKLINMPDPYSDYCFFLPSCFSPNEDGVNDEFYVVGAGIGEFHMKIYKNLNCIFEGNGSIDNIAWDGKDTKGKVYGEGKYKVKVEYVNYNGERKYGTSYLFLIKKSGYFTEDFSNCIFPDQLHPLYGPIYYTAEYQTQTFQ